MDARTASTTKTLNLALIALGLLAVVAASLSVYLYQQNHKLSDDITTKNNQIADLQKKQTTQTPPSKVDPYAGWKSYCDDIRKACFKYPPDWTMSMTNTSNPYGIVSASLKNPTQSVIGNYQNDDTRDGFSNPYYVASIEDLSTSTASLKALGGFVATTTTVYPEYKVVDTPFTTGLTVGQQGTTEDTARFTFPDKHAGTLDLKPTSASGMSQDQAKAWFTTSDAKTAELIVKSFYLE